MLVLEYFLKSGIDATFFLGLGHLSVSLGEPVMGRQGENRELGYLLTFSQRATSRLL